MDSAIIALLEGHAESAEEEATNDEAKARVLAAVEERLGGTLDTAGVERFRAFVVEAFDPENPHELKQGYVDLEPEEAVEQAIKLVFSLAAGNAFKRPRLRLSGLEQSTELRLALMMGGAVVSQLLTVENTRDPLTSWPLDPVNDPWMTDDAARFIEIVPDHILSSHMAAALKHATSVLSIDLDYDDLEFMEGGLHESMASAYKHLMSRLVPRCTPSVLDAHISWILSVAEDKSCGMLNLLSALPEDALKRSGPDIVALASAEECLDLHEVLPDANGIDIATALGFSILDVIALLEPAQLSGCVPTLLSLLKHPKVEPSSVAPLLRQCDPQSLLRHQATLGEMQAAPHSPEVMAIASELMDTLFAPPQPGHGTSSSMAGAGFVQTASNTVVGKKRPASNMSHND